MKKLVLILLTLFLAADIRAAVKDRFGNDFEAIPRSSITSQGEGTTVLLDTGAIVIRTVHITSAAANSWIEFYNTTSAATTPVSIVPVGTATFGSLEDFNWYASTGVAYKKFGTATIKINWDRVTPGGQSIRQRYE